MQAFAVTILWGAFVAFVYISAHQHQQQPLLIDAASPDAWLTYAAATPDVVCIHVLTPKTMRQRNGEVNKT